MVDKDVNEGTLTATDFTVQVEQEPHKDHQNDLKGVYWAWAERVLEDSGQDYQDPNTGHYDTEQDKVFNVNIGLSNLEYLGLQDRMG